MIACYLIPGAFAGSVPKSPTRRAIDTTRQALRHFSQLQAGPILPPPTPLATVRVVLASAKPRLGQMCSRSTRRRKDRKKRKKEKKGREKRTPTNWTMTAELIGVLLLAGFTPSGGVAKGRISLLAVIGGCCKKHKKLGPQIFMTMIGHPLP